MKKLFKCSICGYIHEGYEAPEVCPKCNLGKEKFTELSSEDAEKKFMLQIELTAYILK